MKTTLLSLLTLSTLACMLTACDSVASPDSDAGSGAAPTADASLSTDASIGSMGSMGSMGSSDAGSSSATDSGSSALADAGSMGTGPSPTAADPSIAGPYSVASSANSVSRSGRNTPLTIHAPGGVSTPPVMILLPGFQLNHSRYTALAERIASHGFLVVQADPPASLLGADHTAMRDDVIAVIDWMLGGGLSVDSSRIAIGGHSLGGKVATMVTATDRRIAALLAIDPVNGAGPRGGYSDSLPDIVPSPTNAITVPTGFMGEITNGSVALGMACAPMDQNFQTFYDAATRSAWAAEWTFAGADHMDFVTNRAGCLTCNICLPYGSADEGEVVSAMLTLSVAFLRQHLYGEEHNDWLTGSRVPSIVSARTR